MSEDCYCEDTIGALGDKLKESEEYIDLLKERLEEKDVTIRELQQEIELLKGLKGEYLTKWTGLKDRIEQWKKRLQSNAHLIEYTHEMLIDKIDNELLQGD